MRKIHTYLFLAILTATSFFTPSLHGAQNKPPEVSASAHRDGLVVYVEGTVRDENVDTVSVHVAGSGVSAKPLSPILVVDGRFSTQVLLGFDEDIISIVAEDAEGLVDEESVEIAFAP